MRQPFNLKFQSVSKASWTINRLNRLMRSRPVSSANERKILNPRTDAIRW